MITHISTEKIDQQLREIAVNDWQKFCNLMTPKGIKIARVNLMKLQGHKLDYIAAKNQLSESQVRRACKKCTFFQK